MTERLYEGLFLVDAAVAATDWADIEKQISGLIEQQGATIEYSERWPEQRLAYPVKGIKRGVYFLAYFTSNTDAIAAIRSDGQLNENVLRMLIIQEEFLGVEMAKRKEAAARAAAVPVAEPETQPESKSESKSESDSESDSGSEGEGVAEDAMAASEGDSLDAATPAADADSDGEVVGDTEAGDTEAGDTEAVDTEAVDTAAVDAEVVDAAESEPEVSESEVPEEVAAAEGDEETPVDDSVEEVANTEEEIN